MPEENIDKLVRTRVLSEAVAKEKGAIESALDINGHLISRVQDELINLVDQLFPVRAENIQVAPSTPPDGPERMGSSKIYGTIHDHNFQLGSLIDQLQTLRRDLET